MKDLKKVFWFILACTAILTFNVTAVLYVEPDGRAFWLLFSLPIVYILYTNIRRFWRGLETNIVKHSQIGFIQGLRNSIRQELSMGNPPPNMPFTQAQEEKRFELLEPIELDKARPILDSVMLKIKSLLPILLLFLSVSAFGQMADPIYTKQGLETYEYIYLGYAYPTNQEVYVHIDSEVEVDNGQVVLCTHPGDNDMFAEHLYADSLGTWEVSIGIPFMGIILENPVATPTYSEGGFEFYLIRNGGQKSLLGWDPAFGVLFVGQAMPVAETQITNGLNYHIPGDEMHPIWFVE